MNAVEREAWRQGEEQATLIKVGDSLSFVVSSAFMAGLEAGIAISAIDPDAAVRIRRQLEGGGRFANLHNGDALRLIELSRHE